MNRIAKQLNPWRGRRRLFPEDHFLRSHGFRIEARPNAGPALWRRGQLVCAHERAVELALRGEQAAKERVLAKCKRQKRS